MSNIIDYWQNEWDNAADTSAATDTSGLFAAPEEVKTKWKQGHYYKKDGTWLFNKGNSNAVYVKKETIPDFDFEKEAFDFTNKEFSATDLSTAYTNDDFTLLEIVVFDFLRICALCNSENHEKKAKFAQANAAYNRYLLKEKNFDRAFNSFSGSETNDLHKRMMNKSENGYNKFYNKTEVERNGYKDLSGRPLMKYSIAAVINAFTNGFDYSNGAIGWHGIDVTIPGWKAYDNFVIYGGFKWAENAIIEGRITSKTFLNNEGEKGYYYTITASYGKSIYWKKTK